MKKSRRKRLFSCPLIAQMLENGKWIMDNEKCLCFRANYIRNCSVNPDKLEPIGVNG